MKLEREFSEAVGQSIYSVLPRVVETTFEFRV